MNHDNLKLGIIGLGYVGLPLAIEFGKLFPTLGFDVDKGRVDELKNGYDRNNEANGSELDESHMLSFVYEECDLSDCNVYIVTVPTPVDANKNPNLKPLQSASYLIGKHMRINDVVIFESTVYPGVTEEECVPILEEASGLKYNQDFFCGYSPERINPGDKNRNLPSIVKVTSGSNEDISTFVDDLYRQIITAGTFKAKSIKVAEASKVIENIQRDVNIALVNELSIIFKHLGINIYDVIEAASTKWNFVPMQPGLVGGHCISIDPYYLTYKSSQLNYSPDIILASRKINENMGRYSAGLLIKAMIQKEINIVKSKVLIMGLTFKEDCPDLRNTKVVDVIKELEEYGVTTSVFDPVADMVEATSLVGDSLILEPETDHYDAVVITVPHGVFIKGGIKKIHHYAKAIRVIFDVKGRFDRELVDMTL
mgnify:CR=1 FL=1